MHPSKLGLGANLRIRRGGHGGRDRCHGNGERVWGRASAHGELRKSLDRWAVYLNRMSTVVSTTLRCDQPFRSTSAHRDDHDIVRRIDSS